MGVLQGTIHKGELTERIALVRPMHQVTITGLPVERPASYLNLWAKHESERVGMEDIQGGKETATSFHRFYVIWDHAQGVSPTWNVQYNNHTYDIEEILEVGYREYLCIRAKQRI